MLLRDFGVKLKSCLCKSAASSVCLPNQNDGPSQKLFVPRSAGACPRVHRNLTRDRFSSHQKLFVPRSAEACPPLASEPGEGQALAYGTVRWFQSLVAEECTHYEQKST